MVRLRSSHVDLEKKLKSVAGKPIFYVTLDPERALGLEDVLPNYTIICPYKSELTEQLKSLTGILPNVLVLEEHLPGREVEKAVQRGSYGILQCNFVKSYITKTCHIFSDRKTFDKFALTPHFLFLKNSQLIEDFCKKQGWKLLAPKAKVAEKFENKNSQYKLLKGVVDYPRTFLCAVSETADVGKEFGSYLSGTSAGERAWSPTTVGGASRGQNEAPRWGDESIPKDNFQTPYPLVLQFNRGHSGNSTYFIKSKKDLEKLCKLFPNRECKVSEYIKGKTYTLNCVVLKSGKVVTGSISEQITGLKEATNNPNTTCGNDFISPRKLKIGQIKKLQEIAQEVGKTLHKNGYRGMFGIDAIIESVSGKVYFIELNTHQPASTSFEAKLHRKIGKMPLLAYFMLDSFGSNIRFSKMGAPPIILPIFAKQIIYRNKSSKVLKLKEVEKKYKNKGLLTRMKFIKPNEEIYRKQNVT